jgi:hypothetical protein
MIYHDDVPEIFRPQLATTATGIGQIARTRAELDTLLQDQFGSSRVATDHTHHGPGDMSRLALLDRGSHISSTTGNAINARPGILIHVRIEGD